MALANYTDLQASIASFGNRNDLTTQIPDFIALCEARIARDLRLRGQIASTTLATVANTQHVTLPTDWLETENMTVDTSPPRTLSVVSPEMLDVKFPTSFTGAPAVYTVVGSKMLLGPVPDGVYTITMDYYQRLPALSSQSTNFLLTAYPGLYLAGSLVEMALYVGDEAAMAKWEARYRSEVESVQRIDDIALRSGSAMRVRTV